MPNSSKRFTNYFYEFQTSEKYISNSSEIKKKQNPHKEVREERLSQGVPCSRSCVRQGHRHRHDCLLDVEAEAERTHAWSQAGGGRRFRIARPRKRLTTTDKSTGWSLAFLFLYCFSPSSRRKATQRLTHQKSPVTIQDWFLLALVLDLGANVIKGVAQ